MDPIKIIEKYYTVGSDLYKLLLQHSQDVAKRSLQIIEAHPELKVDKDFVYEAAFLHDIGVFLTDAPGIFCFGKEPYLMHGFLGAEILRSEGLHRHALVCERHTGTGLSSDEIYRRDIALPPGIYMPQTTEERLVCYADKFFSKTKPGRSKKLAAIRKSIASYGNDSLLRFDAMHGEFALSDDE